MGYLGSYDDLCYCDIYNYVTKQFMEDYDWQESFALTCGTKEQQDYYKNLFKDKFNKKNMRIEGEDRYFSAEDARRVSEEISKNKTNEQLDWIYKLINDARFDGKRSVTFSNKKLFESTKNFLEGKGFKVTHFYGDQRDPADDTTISW